MSLLSSVLNNRAIRSLSAVLDRRIVENASALYAAQFANQILPLLMIPYLARVLGPDTWGVVVFIQAIGMYLLLVIDYAFDISATRDVARHREDDEQVAQIVAGVLGGRIILSAVTLSIVAVAQIFTPALRDLGWLLWLGMFWFTVASFRPFWLFLGFERVRGVLALEVTLKAIAVASVIVFVNAPQDAWRVFAIQGIASTVSVLAAMGLMYRFVPFRFPSISRSIDELKRGWNLFVFQASASVYGMSNTFILGLLASPVSVAFYAGAERIIGVLIRTIHPANQAMYPRASALAVQDQGAAARFARTSIVGLFCVTTVGVAVLYYFAPLIVRIALGPDYGESATVLRILLLALPIIAVKLPLSTHWMVPNGLDGLLKKITLGIGIVHFPMAVALASSFGHTGIAWSLVITEGLILGLLLIILTIRRAGPFSFGESGTSAKVNSWKVTT
jgi:polysaccharide transporter, PST family